jgi:hypothetical protein
LIVASFIDAFLITADRIFNLDETAVYFDNAPIKTIDERGKKSLTIAVGATASQRVTVFLCVSFSGQK